MNPIRIIGIGNSLAGDDAIGSLIIKVLDEKKLPSVDVIDAGGAGLGILDLLHGGKAAIFIDAMHSNRQPGTIHRLTIPADLGLLVHTSWNSTTTSTHGFGLGETLTLGHTLGTLPPTTLVYGIEMEQSQMGAELSPNVKETVKTVVSAIEKDIATQLCTNSNS